MTSHEQIDAETQAIVDQNPELEHAWHAYKQARATEIGQIIFKDMGLYEGFEYSVERAFDERTLS